MIFQRQIGTLLPLSLLTLDIFRPVKKGSLHKTWIDYLPT